MSQLNIPSFIVPPSADWTLFPSSLHVDPGNYRILVTGKLQPHSINTGQCLFKLNWNEASGPAIGAINWRGLLMGEGGTSGNLGENTGNSEMSSVGAGVAPAVYDFLRTEKVEVVTGGPLTLIANVQEVSEGAAEVVTFTDVIIEIVPA